MIGVVADDTTGANDIGIMFANKGLLTKILTFHEDLVITPDTDVVIIDTDSRLDSAEISYHKVYSATKLLQGMGCRMFHKKTCSVFRGNIGAEFDAMLDALEENFAVVSLAFPKNGRQTEHGIHRVHGSLLEESEFACDPVHPMRQSNLIDILQGQTKRKVAYIDISIVRQGAIAVRNAIAQKRSVCNYCIVDTVDQNDLHIVAEATYDFPVLAGSSAIAEELPEFWPPSTAENILESIPSHSSRNVLIVAGSLTPQTKKQTRTLVDAGFPASIIDTRFLFDTEERNCVLQAAIINARKGLLEQKDVLVMADNDPAVVQQTKDMGRQLGIDTMTISRMVSAALADVTDQLITQVDINRLVIAGGDTAGTICRKLGIRGNYVLREIETGVPSGRAIGRDMFIVLKSGSFGSPDFLIKATKHLKELV